MLISPPPWRGFLYIPFSRTFPEEIRDFLSFRGEEVKFSPQGMPFEKTPYHFIVSLNLFDQDISGRFFDDFGDILFLIRLKDSVIGDSTPLVGIEYLFYGKVFFC